MSSSLGILAFNLWNVQSGIKYTLNSDTYVASISLFDCPQKKKRLRFRSHNLFASVTAESHPATFFLGTSPIRISPDQSESLCTARLINVHRKFKTEPLIDFSWQLLHLAFARDPQSKEWSIPPLCSEIATTLFDIPTLPLGGASLNACIQHVHIVKPVRMKG